MHTRQRINLEGAYVPSLEDTNLEDDEPASWQIFPSIELEIALSVPELGVNTVLLSTAVLTPLTPLSEFQSADIRSTFSRCLTVYIFYRSTMHWAKGLG